MESVAAGESRPEFKLGWRTLVGATGAAASGAGLYTYAASYFVKPLEAAFGWSRAEIALGATLGLIAAALCAPVAGALTDRFGARRIGVTALTGYGLLCLALAALPASLPVFYLLGTAIAIMYSATTAVVFAPLVVAKFKRRRGLALGIMMSGTGILLTPLAPLLIALNTHVSWRAGYAVLGTWALVVGVPCAILASHGSTIARGAKTVAGGMPLKAAVRTLPYWQLVGGVIAGMLPLGGFIHQLSPLFLDRGRSVPEVSALASFFLIAVIVGRTGVGLLLDVVRPSLVCLTVMIGAAGAALLLLQPDASLLVCVLAVALLGCAIGAEGDMQAFFAARLFGLSSYSNIFGTLALCTSGGTGIGAYIFGKLHDVEGGYHTALIFACISFLVSGALFGGLTPRRIAAAELREPELAGGS